MTRWNISHSFFILPSFNKSEIDFLIYINNNYLISYGSILLKALK